MAGEKANAGKGMQEAASVALIRDGAILLIRRAFAPYRDLWTLPGGGLDAGESLEACARREIGEELGLAVRGLRRIGTQSARTPRGAWRIAVFASRDFDGTLVPSAEIAEFRWADPEMAARLRTTARLGVYLRRALAALPD